MSRLGQAELSGGGSGGKPNNGLRREIWTSTPVSGHSTPRGFSGLTGRHSGSRGSVPDSPTSSTGGGGGGLPFSQLAGQKQSRMVMSPLYQGFAWDSGPGVGGALTGDAAEDEEEELPQYTVRILPVVVPGIMINDELVQEPRKMHMAVNVRVEPEKTAKHKGDSGRLERSGSVISLDGVDDDTISGFSDMTNSSTVHDDDDDSLDDSSDDGSGSGSGDGSDSDLD